ncbi:MAG: glycosyltransferase family 4 protein [Proteobacteria bacterium]|nr:glycosyltransferase family 4 protein [Pseudomonadota bacterium]
MDARSPRSLAGATVLQMLPALRDDPTVIDALNVVMALLRAGARPIVAAASGPLVSELRSMGCDFLELDGGRAHGLRQRRQVRQIASLIRSENVDVVHGHGSLASWGAVRAAAGQPCRVVISLPADAVPPRRFGRLQARASSAISAIVVESAYAGAILGQRLNIARRRFSVIPHSIDTAGYDPARIPRARGAALREAWHINPQERVVLAPGLVAPEHGHAILPDVARILRANGHTDVIYAVPGDIRGKRRYFRAVAARARRQNVDDIFCLGAPPADVATILSVADLVVVAASSADVSGRLVVEAQSMACPVIASAIGALPEMLLAPPRMPQNLRTGWLVRPDDPVELAGAIATALALPPGEREAMGRRARQFATSTFSPAGVAAATLSVYTSLLEYNG